VAQLSQVLFDGGYHSAFRSVLPPTHYNMLTSR